MPAAAGGGAVIREGVEAFDLATLRPAIAADLLEHRLCVDVAAVVHLRVVERDVTDRLVAFLRAVGVERLQPLAEVIHEPQLGAAVARPIDDLVVPLHQPMGIGEGALLFAGKLRRHEEDLRLDLLRPQLAVANRMALRTEIGTPDLVGVALPQTVEFATPDRKSVVSGKSVTGSVILVGCRILKK